MGEQVNCVQSNEEYTNLGLLESMKRVFDYFNANNGAGVIVGLGLIGVGVGAVAYYGRKNVPSEVTQHGQG